MPSALEAGLWDLLRTRLLSFSLILVLTFLMMVSIVVSAALAVLEHLMGQHLARGGLLAGIAVGIDQLSVIVALFAVIYKMLPRGRLSWHDVAIGALGTAGLFALGKYAIGLYTGNSGSRIDDCPVVVGVLLSANFLPGASCIIMMQDEARSGSLRSKPKLPVGR